MVPDDGSVSSSAAAARRHQGAQARPAADRAGTILAYFGAEVIEVEPPGAGDPIRHCGCSTKVPFLWWRSLGVSFLINQRRTYGISSRVNF